MKATGFDGREYNWNLTKRVPKKNDKRHRSKLHLRARSLLRQIFPRARILEEVRLPGSGTTTKQSGLFADFFLPAHNLIIEVNGRQHYEFVKFYHKTNAGYYQARKRDRDKIEWCKQNNISIVTLKYSDDDNVWKKNINSERTSD